MNLYMYGEFSKEVTNITLKDGCYPCIGDQVSDQLEPAIWFKVLVLDAISIDCNKRVVLWHTSSDLESLEKEAHQGHAAEPEQTELDANNRQANKDGNDNEECDDLNSKEGKGSVQGEGDSHGDKQSYRSILRFPSSRRSIQRQMSETVYAAGECMGYSGDMEEVFELTQEILSKLVMGKMPQTEFNQQVFRLLHVYILPNIQLSPDDIANVQNALAVIECFITDVDDFILEKQKRIDRVKQDMKKLRQTFIGEVCELSFSNTAYPLAFAEVLLRHLAGDIAVAQDELNELTKKVEAAKFIAVKSSRSEMSSENGDGCDEELLHLRSERDEFMKEFNNLLTARAILDEYISTERSSESISKERRGLDGKKNSKKKCEKARKSKRKSSLKLNSCSDRVSPLHDIYYEMEEICQELTADTLALADQKVLLLSVKQAMHDVLETLLSGRETLGIDIDAMGMRRPTDVLRHSHIPLQWLSLPEQVSSIIKDEDLSVGQAHAELCKLVREKCKLALQRQQLTEISDLITQESSPPETSITKTGGLFAENKLYSLRHFDSLSQSSGISSNMSDTCGSHTSNLSKSGTYDQRSVACSDTHLTSSGSSCEPLALSLDRMQLNKSKTPSITSEQLSDSLDSDLNASEEVEVIEDRSDLESVITWIKGNINNRFEAICLMIQERLGNGGQSQFRRIWQCYEMHFYAEVIGVLSDIYIEMYCPKVRCVLDQIQVLRASDLDLSGFILNILEDGDEMSEFSTESGSRMSAISDLTDATCATVCTELTLPSSEKTLTGSSGSPVESPSSDSVSTLDPNAINDAVHCLSNNVHSGTNTAKGKNADQSGEISLMSSVDSLDNSCQSQPTVHIAIETNSQDSFSEGADSKDSQVVSVAAKRPSSIFMDASCKDQSNNLVPSSSNSLSSQSSHISDLSSSANDTVVSTSEQSTDTDDNQNGDNITYKVVAISQPMPMSVVWKTFRESPFQCREQSTNGMPLSPLAMTRAKCLRLKPEHARRFVAAYKMLKQVLENKSPLLKLQGLFRCLRELSNQYEQLQKTFCGQSTKPCTDDLIDILALFLANFDPSGAMKLYAHVMMLSDLMPRFFAGGQFSFTLVQFVAAFQVLKERSLMKNAKQQLKKALS